MYLLNKKNNGFLKRIIEFSIEKVNKKILNYILLRIRFSYADSKTNI